MTTGEAVNDLSTALGRAAKQTSDDRAERIARAREIAELTGISFEDAIMQIWTQAVIVP